MAKIVVTITLIKRARIHNFLPTHNDNLALLIAITSSSIVTRNPRHIIVTIATVAIFKVRLNCLATSITKGQSRRRR